MSLTVGHNDPGYLPDVEPIEVGDLNTAVLVLATQVVGWFAPELAGEELTEQELREFVRRVRSLRQRSTLILRGHAFWIQ